LKKKEKKMIELKEGIYQGITNDEYHADKECVSNSYLGRLGVVPAKALVEQKETKALTFGQAFHVYVLENEIFHKSFIIGEDRGHQKKEDKEYWADLSATAISRNMKVLDYDDYELIKNMNDAVYSHPFAKELLSKGVSEQTIIWQDEETGLWCKVRPDRIPDGGKGVILNLKSTSNAAEHPFQGDCVKYGYARAAGMELEGYSRVTKTLYADLIYAEIAVEKEAPFRCEVYPFDVGFLEYGFAEFHRLLHLEYKCRKNKFYPHYKYPGGQTLMAPGYLKVWEFEELEK
jgi:hypothetical protein